MQTLKMMKIRSLYCGSMPTVVPDGKTIPCHYLCFHADFPRVFAAELNTVADKVLKQVVSLVDFRELSEGSAGHFCVRFLNRGTEIFNSF